MDALIMICLILLFNNSNITSRDFRNDLLDGSFAKIKATPFN